MTTASAIPIAREAEVGYTDQDWGRRPDDRRYELVDGELVELPPMRFSQATVASQLVRLFARYIQNEGLPYLTSVDASFRLGLSQGNFRIPDAHVTAARRVLASIDDEPSAWEGSPDIAVEVVSPTDAYVDVVAKALLYLNHGVSTVLLIDLYHREVTVRQSTGEIHVLTADGMLTGEPILPGFSCPVAEIFSDLDRILLPETEGN